MNAMDVANIRLHPYKLVGGEVRVEFDSWLSPIHPLFRIWRRSDKALWENQLVACYAHRGIEYDAVEKSITCHCVPRDEAFWAP